MQMNRNDRKINERIFSNHFCCAFGVESAEVLQRVSSNFSWWALWIFWVSAIASCWILSFLAFDAFILAGRCVAFPVESKGVVAQIETQLLGN